MNPIDTLTGAAILLAFPLFMVGLLFVIAPDGVPLDDLHELPMDTPSARGIREEEPVRWRLDLLQPRHAASPSGAVRFDRPARHEAGIGERPSPHAA
jgi:hypothetical protein